MDELIIDKTSNYVGIGNKFLKLQQDYAGKFVKEYERRVANDSKLLDEERMIYDCICKMIQTDVFMQMMGNFDYREKVKNAFANERYVLGESKMKLISLKHTIETLCESYLKEYNSFINNSKRQMEAGLKQIDSETKKEIRSIFETKVSTAGFYNRNAEYMSKIDECVMNHEKGDAIFN